MTFEPRDLVHELTERGRAPAGLEEHAVTAWTGDRRNAPALEAGDRGEQKARVADELARDQGVHLEEEPRLISGAELGMAPFTGDREVGHTRGVGDGIQAPVADDRPALGGGVVVADVDHRIEERVARRVDLAPAERVQPAEVGDEQHRLDDAAGHERAVDVRAGHPTFAVEDRKRGSPEPGGQEPRRASDRSRGGEPDGQRSTALITPAEAATRPWLIEQRRGAGRVEAGPEAKPPGREGDRRVQSDHVLADPPGARRRSRVEAGVPPDAEGPPDRCPGPAQITGVEDQDRHAGASEGQGVDCSDGAVADSDADRRLRRRADELDAVVRVAIGPDLEPERAVGAHRRALEALR